MWRGRSTCGLLGGTQAAAGLPAEAGGWLALASEARAAMIFSGRQVL